MLLRIELDTKLAGPRIVIPASTASLDSSVVQLLQLEAENYLVQIHPSSDTSWQFEVTAQGLFEYTSNLDVTESALLTDGLMQYIANLDVMQRDMLPAGDQQS